MHIKRIDVKNFRLLKSVELSLETRTTVIVGRNNCGKTSLAEFFRRMLSQKLPTFRLEDFSLATHELFWGAFLARRNGADDSDTVEKLPAIEANLIVSYHGSESNIGLLDGFIIDVNGSCTDVLIEIRYELEAGQVAALLDEIDLGIGDESLQKARFFRVLRERVHRVYKSTLWAVDPNEPTNRQPLDWSRLRSLLQSGFINAQRGLDDTTDSECDVIGNILGVLFSTAMSEAADPKDQTTAEKLQAAVQSIQEDIDGKFNKQLEDLIPAFEIFGYPSLRDPKLRTQTALDVARLLTNHTKVHYAGGNGLHLPEAYNGLGARNLIYILLKLLEFFKKWRATQPSPGVNLIFIEEPEAHLHPQMQEVFIQKLSEVAAIFAREYNAGAEWPVQFVVTTHSSHLANRAPFKSIRYFYTPPFEEGLSPFTLIKDLGKGFSGSLKDDEEFLHQYMTLTRCDLFFADKAVLIEGTSERLLIPKMIEKHDKGKPVSKQLSSQYLSVIEVGGAYAHRFFKLLQFLELRTLVITDIDSVQRSPVNKLIPAMCSEGTATSNGCIKEWFAEPAISPSDLLAKSDTDKIRGILRLSYQIPEKSGEPCGRSLEAAFILANPALFSLNDVPLADRESDAWKIAEGEKKSEFALRHAIENTEWNVPRYILEGLTWLADAAERPNGSAAPEQTLAAPALAS